MYYLKQQHVQNFCLVKAYLIKIYIIKYKRVPKFWKEITHNIWNQEKMLGDKMELLEKIIDKVVNFLNLVQK